MMNNDSKQLYKMYIKTKTYWSYYLILALCIFFSFYFAIGAYPLFDNNEGLYADIAKYMVLHKDFIIPHANGVIYIEKPPLLYWLMSFSFSIFGFTAFAARLVTASSAALICLALVYFGKKIKNSELGLISAIIFASSIGISIIARMVYFDMLFTLMISGALLSFFYWYNSLANNSVINNSVAADFSLRFFKKTQTKVCGYQEKPQENYHQENRRQKNCQKLYSMTALRIGYIFCALAVLTKGLIALVLIGGSFGMFLLLQKDYRKFYQMLDPVGIALFLIVALPWHIAATLRHQGFAWNYLIEEHFLRFLGQREPHDYYSGPVYYYLPRIMIYIFPWSLYLLVVFGQKVRTINLLSSLRAFFAQQSRRALKKLDCRGAKSAPSNDGAWQLIKRVCHKMTKLFAMTIFKKPLDNHKLLSFCWCWFLVPLLFFSISSAKANYYMIVGMPALAMIIGFRIKNLLNNPKIKMAFLAVAVLIIPLVLLMVWYIKNHEADLSSAATGIYLSQQAKKLSLYVYQDFEDISALFFYAPGSFKIIDTKSHDLYYGAKLPQFSKIFITKETWPQELKNSPFYVIVPEKKLLDFKNYMSGINHVLLKKIGKLMVFMATKA